MKIAIDASKAVNESAGIARYTQEIIKNLSRLYPKDKFFLYFNFLRGKEEKNKKIESLVAGQDNINYKIYPIMGYLKERLFNFSFPITKSWVKNCDVVHATEFLSFDNGLKIPQVLTVHDLTMIKFPTHRGKEAIRHGKILKKACLNANQIISVSHSTKKDLIDLFDINPDKISVIHLGANKNFRRLQNQNESKKALLKYKINFPFILFLGTVEPRKNIKNLLLAFEKFSENSQFKDARLIIIGKKGWNSEEIFTTHDSLKFKNKVLFLDFVPNEDIIHFYNQAILFCFPSLYEGFGFPILEAMACGCPVLTSNISSLPEVGGNAAYYINPQNIKEIADAMQKILVDNIMRENMVKLGIEQAKKFSWERCAEETHKVYEEALKNEKQ